MEPIKNLKNYQELTPSEIEGISGGVFWFILGGIIIAVTGEIVRDWDNFKAGLTGQPEIKS